MTTKWTNNRVREKEGASTELNTKNIEHLRNDKTEQLSVCFAGVSKFGGVLSDVRKTFGSTHLVFTGAVVAVVAAGTANKFPNKTGTNFSHLVMENYCNLMFNSKEMNSYENFLYNFLDILLGLFICSFHFMFLFPFILICHFLFAIFYLPFTIFHFEFL